MINNLQYVVCMLSYVHVKLDILYFVWIHGRRLNGLIDSNLSRKLLQNLSRPTIRVLQVT